MDQIKGPLQKLLLMDEYSDLEDIVLLEATFVELDKCGDALQQVVLGLSPDHLLLGRRYILNWKEDPAITSTVDVDLAVDGMELKWIIPLRSVDISTVPEDFILKVSARHTRSRYFELSTVREGNSKWDNWLDRIKYLQDDPYGYISHLPLRRGSSMSLTSSESSMFIGQSKEGMDSPKLAFDLDIPASGEGPTIEENSTALSTAEDEKEEKNELIDQKVNVSKGSKRKNIFRSLMKKCKCKDNSKRSKGKG
ncbi:uncharacterized protein LOC124149754 [Haliotis rufescens]|uniref:uncharacterized protein LOC124149754 n=1 Tax=Haliotis rufescens TaxID=6454 RepID=UPI00201F50AD|nr:uncharacterized protein LOC124149754 [Haliotis rufescens]